MSYEEAMSKRIPRLDAMAHPLQDIKYRNGGMAITMLDDEPEVPTPFERIFDGVMYALMWFLAGMVATVAAVLWGMFFFGGNV